MIIHKQPAVIDKKKTEQYYDQKYDKPRINLLDIFDEYPECNQTEIPDFEPEEVGTVLKSLPRGNAGESTVSGMRIIKITLSHQNRKNDLILIMTPEKQDKTLELSKHWSVDSTPARNEVIMKRTYPVKSVKCDKICSNY